MIDVKVIDQWYKVTEGNLVFGVFNKRMLLPVAQLPDAVRNETEESISLAEVLGKADAGWFPLLPMEDPQEGTGWPLYAPSRIGMLLKLEREGYVPEELRLIADLEEYAIDNIYAADEMAYVDDDLDTLILAAKDRIDTFDFVSSEGESQSDRNALWEKAQKELTVLERFKAEGIPDRLQETVRRNAFRIRAWWESIRLHLMETDRAKIQQGYSPYASFRGQRSGPEGYTFTDLDWDSSINAALAYAPEGIAPSLRVPGFVLRGERITPTHTMPPSEYTEAWKARGLDTYLQTWHRLNGGKCCLSCSTPIDPTKVRKQFCSERCRNAMKARRYRENHPDRVIENQKRYYESIRED